MKHFMFNLVRYRCNFTDEETGIFMKMRALSKIIYTKLANRNYVIIDLEMLFGSPSGSLHL